MMSPVEAIANYIADYCPVDIKYCWCGMDAILIETGDHQVLVDGKAAEIVIRPLDARYETKMSDPYHILISKSTPTTIPMADPRMFERLDQQLLAIMGYEPC